jgi:hypothetical protein
MAVSQKMVKRIVDELVVIREKLENYKQQKEYVLDNENDKENPNEDRVDKFVECRSNKLKYWEPKNE